MSEKINELDEQLDQNPQQDITEEEINAANGKVSLEENDNWTFEAEAPMLNANIAGEDFEIDIPEPKVSNPLPKPTPAAPKPVAPPQNDKVSKNDKIMFTLTALIIVVLVALLTFLGVRYYTVPNSDEKMNPGNVAVTVDGTDVSIGLYNYYFTMVYSEYTSGQYELDPYTDFSQQKTTDDDGKEITWAEKMDNETIERIKTDVASYNMAVDAGATLSDDQKKEIDEAIDSLKETASQADKTIDQYLKENYGDYCGQATIRKLLNQYYLAQNYAKEQSVTFTITDEELAAYTKEHTDDYKKVTIAYLPITFSPSDTEAADKAVADAKKYAQQIKTKDDMKLLIPKVWKGMIDQYVEAGYYPDEESCILDIAENMEADITKNMDGFVEEALVWLFDENTKVNDVETFAQPEDGVVYIFMKVSEPEFDESEVYSVRHILISPETDSEETDDGETQAKDPTEAQWADAEKKANDVLAEYNKGEKTEAEFAKLAEKYSADTGSISSGMQSYGGIYAGVPLGQMVSEFEKWATDDSRKYGDVDIVKTDYGYHIMFFIDDMKQYEHDIKTAALAEKQEKMFDDVRVKVNKVSLKKAKKAEPMEIQDDDVLGATDESAQLSGEEVELPDEELE